MKKRCKFVSNSSSKQSDLLAIKEKSDSFIMTSIFVAKLDFGVDNQQLKALFEKHGTVLKANVAMDRETGKSRGFGFVEMSDKSEAQAAIEALDGSEVNGRPIAVKEAEDRGGQKKPFSNNRSDGPRNDGPRTPSDNRDRPRTDTRGYDEPKVVVPFIPDTDAISKVPRKVGKDKDKLKASDKPKTHKMEAYKKSGKSNRFFGDDDDDDEDIPPLFGYDDDEDYDSDDEEYDEED